MLNQLFMREDWTAALDNGMFVDVIFMDFSKAFDKVSHLDFIQRLSSLGITGAVQERTGNLLCDHRQRVIANETLSQWKPLKKVCPWYYLSSLIFPSVCQ